MTRLAPNLAARRPRRGFTLVELLISIALVLLLMTGVVQVFKYAGDAVGTSLAVAEVTRSQRALLVQIPSDGLGLNDDVLGTPAILIDSQQNDVTVASVPAGNTLARLGPMFLNRADELNAGKVDLADQQFRFDQFSYLTHGAFTRQTGNDGQFGSTMASGWGRVWYGHLWLPGNAVAADLTNNNTANAVTYLAAAGVPTYPGLGTSLTNPNNYYANQWTLGRVATLILPKNYPFGAAATEVTQGTNLQSFYDWPQTAGGDDNDPASGRWPVNFGAPAHASTLLPSIDPKPGPIQQFRYDLAAVRSVNNDPFLDYFYPGLANTPTAWNGSTATASHYFANWWVPADPTATGTVPPTFNYRFQSNATPVRSLDSVKVASASPALVSGCVSFYVEFSGDFTTQDGNDGSVTAAKPDGVIDYYLEKVGTAATGTPRTVRHTRWYGLDRSTSGARVTAASTGGLPVGSPLIDYDLGTAAGYNPDVHPVAFFAGTAMPFEKGVVGVDGNASPVKLDKGIVRYICAWDATPDAALHALSPTDYTPAVPRPSLFRVTVVQTDVTGRLGAGRSSQYLLPVAKTVR